MLQSMVEGHIAKHGEQQKNTTRTLESYEEKTHAQSTVAACTKNTLISQ